MSLTEKIAEYIYAAEESEEALQKGLDCFADTFACMILGSKDLSGEKAVKYVKTNMPGQQASVYCKAMFQTTLEGAIFANGVFSHNCDFDDMTTAGCGHPSVPVFPLVLAIAEQRHKSGEEMLKAYMKGMEVSMRMGAVSLRKGFSHGWNPTTVIGIFGAVAAASVLLGLDGKQIKNALSLAVCKAGGTRGNYGTEGKNIEVASLGIKALHCVRLAKLGIQASPEGMEGEDGYLKCFTGDPRGEEIEKAFEKKESYLIDPGIIQKPYPTCRSNHNAIDGGIFFHNKRNKDIGQIEKIQCFIDGPSAALDLFNDPKTPEEGKFSLAYCLSLALLDGEIKPETFLSKGKIDQRAKELMDKITIEETAEWKRPGHFINQVNMILKDGRTEEYLGEYGKGHPKNPLTDEEKYRKFVQCLKGSFREDRIPKLYSCLKNLAEVRDYCAIRDIVAEEMIK